MTILIALPAHNEESILAATVATLEKFCRDTLNDKWHIVIAENGSTDATADIACDMERTYQSVTVISVPMPGKGNAIRHAWNTMSANVYCFMDADLATDLSALPEALLAIRGGADLAIGSRFHKRSVVDRSLSRRALSLGYRFVARYLVGTRVSDLPCGFKLITSNIKEVVLPDVANDGWFFDSELVIRAAFGGYRIAEIPVRWEDRREKTDGSRVRPLRLAWSYLKNLIALRADLRKK
jgi:glycosyltransferase involved in cell wall biosynthesis